MVHQKVTTLYFQSRFSISKIDRFFKNVNLGMDHCSGSWFRRPLSSILETLYLLKLCQYFDELTFTNGFFLPWVFLEYVDSLSKILLCNSTTELILRVYIPLIFYYKLFHGKLPSIWKPNSHFIWCQHPLGNWFLKQSQNIQLPLHSWYWSQPLWQSQLWSY